MLKVAAQCHLHGLVHRDMKPEVWPHLLAQVARSTVTIMSSFCLMGSLLFLPLP